jgi:hypothetical protein
MFRRTALKIRVIAHGSMWLVIATCILVIVGCSTPDPARITTVQNSPAIKQNSPAPTDKKSANANLTANPNPIKVCDGSGLGVTTLTWSAVGPQNLEVRIGAPDGELFSTAPSASYPTAKWVSDGMVAYLQDRTNGKPLTAENTLASLTLRVTTEGCP